MLVDQNRLSRASLYFIFPVVGIWLHNWPVWASLSLYCQSTSCCYKYLHSDLSLLPLQLVHCSFTTVNWPIKPSYLIRFSRAGITTPHFFSLSFSLFILAFGSFLGLTAHCKIPDFRPSKLKFQYKREVSLLAA